MRLTAAFLGHEWRTQWRSPRFRALSLVYIAIVSAPAVVPLVIARKDLSFVGPAAFSGVLDAIQPVATFLFAALLAVDAIFRERDEGSLAIVSLTSISNAGYVLRRWLAVSVIALPVTIAPRIIAAGLAWSASHSTSMVFAAGWLVHALPQLIIGSTLGLALGTITGRTVLAAILGAALFTMGLELVNDLLAHARLRIEGIGGLLDVNDAINQSGMVAWALRGYTPLQAPTDAGVDFRGMLAGAVPAAAVPLAVTAVLIGMAPAFLRRARADLRPWHIDKDHQLYTILQMLNRLRDDYRPDPAPLPVDWLVLGVGLLSAVALVGWTCGVNIVMGRHFEEEYRALQSPSPLPTSTAVMAETVRLRGRVAADGSVRASSLITMRNGGETPQTHFAFSLDPHLVVDRVRIAGRSRVTRNWDRLLVDIDPPLAAGRGISFGFDVGGRPGQHDLESPDLFIRRYGRHRKATESFDMLDFSRQRFTPAVSSIGGTLRASQLMPVPRYTPWNLVMWQQVRHVEEERVTPSVAVTVALEFPRGETVADSCGTLSGASLQSACSVALAHYLAFAAPMKSMPLTSGARFAYIPLHESTARIHAVSFETALHEAALAWPHMQQSPPPLLVERPRTARDDNWWWSDYAWAASGELTGSGSLMFVPEILIARKSPVRPATVAASLVANATTSRRRMVPAQQRFFHDFVFAIALARTGGRSENAVETGAGYPESQPILHAEGWSRTRLRKVLRDIEYRVGPDRLNEGIEDFVFARADGGTALELLHAIGRRANVSLDRVYGDYFEGTAVPKLTLEGVVFRRDGERWIVSGRVANRGTGEAVCPIVLRTAFEPLRRVVRVDTGKEAPFSFETGAEPRAVQLDPERVCYRWAAVGLVDTVEYRGER